MDHVVKWITPEPMFDGIAIRLTVTQGGTAGWVDVGDYWYLETNSGKFGLIFGITPMGIGKTFYWRKQPIRWLPFYKYRRNAIDAISAAYEWYNKRKQEKENAIREAEVCAEIAEAIVEAIPTLEGN